MALFTFLGLWFDGLTWRVHIEAVVARCKRVLNVMRCLVGLDWGTDRRSLRMIFVGLIRFAIDYGCVAYGSACKTAGEFGRGPGAGVEDCKWGF